MPPSAMTPKNYPSRITDEYSSSRMVVDMMRKLYKQNKKKLLNKFLRNWTCKAKKVNFTPILPHGAKIKNVKKTPGDIPPRNNHTKFESNPPGSC